MLVDLRARNEQFTGADAEKALEAAGIIANKNAIYNDPRPPKLTSGIRLGTPSITSRGKGEAEMVEIAGFIVDKLSNFEDPAVHDQVAARSLALCRRFPLPYRAAVPA